jgi:DNA repair exonuclease SbcCD nuclease subunit
MTRFVHTADWQLGMTLHFLSPESQARYGQARIDAVADIGRIVAEQNCEFVVVSGDVFETSRVSRLVVARACEAMAAIPVPVLLLPGNHDPLDAGSVYTSEYFTARQPGNVRLLAGNDVERPTSGVEVLGAPWRSKRPLEDLVAAACADLTHDPTVLRILVGHGAVDTLDPDRDNPAQISLSQLETSLIARRIHYVALGDRHSTTNVGKTGRVWYSGTQEVTDFDELDPGNVLIVDLAGPTNDEPAGTVHVEPVRLGQWRFLREHFELSDETVGDLERWLSAIQDKQRTVVKFSLIGALTLAGYSRLEMILDNYVDLLAGLQRWERHTALVVLPDAGELDELGLSGFAEQTLTQLVNEAVADDGDVVARDALALLHRLAGAR